MIALGVTLSGERVLSEDCLSHGARGEVPPAQGSNAITYLAGTVTQEEAILAPVSLPPILAQLDLPQC